MFAFDLDSAEWSSVETSGGAPAVPLFAGAIYDAERRAMIVAGNPGGTGASEVYALALDGEPVWRRLEHQGAPAAPEIGEGASAYDAASRRWFVYWGSISALDLSAAPATWSAISPHSAPEIAPSRARAALAFDPIARRLVLFGGRDGTVFPGATWTYSLDDGTWSELVAGVVLDDVRPSGVNIAQQFSFYSARTDEVLHVSGFIRGHVTATALSPPHARRVFTPGGPGEVLFQSVTHDPVNERLLRGDHELFELSLTSTAPTWSKHPAGAPGLQIGYALTFDPARSRLIAVGTTSAAAQHVTVQVLSLDRIGSSWTSIMAEGPRPGSRFLPSAFHDPDRDRVVLFGGHGVPHDELWVLELSGPEPRWTQTFASGVKPQPRTFATTLLDPVRRRMLVIGGQIPMIDAVEEDIWALDLEGPPRWRAFRATGESPDYPLSYSYIPAAWTPAGLISVNGDIPGRGTWRLTLEEGCD